MKTALIVLILLSAAVCLGAGYLETDNASRPVQGFAPNGATAQALTINKTTIDMRNNAAWMQYGTTACKFRAMSTTTRAGVQLTLPASTVNVRYVNTKTPFINLSGCTAGELVRQ